MKQHKYPALSPEELKEAVLLESARFATTFRWLENHFPPSFLNEIDSETRTIIARSLLGFALQGKWINIRLKDFAIVCCEEGPEADLKILEPFRKVAIRYYRTFVSNEPLLGVTERKLRIGLIYFRDTEQEKIDEDRKKILFESVKEEYPSLSVEEFEKVIQGLTHRFIHSMNEERLKIALKLFFRAKSRDQCQYDLKLNQDFQTKEIPSMQLVLAWKGVPKGGFLYKLAKIIHSHKLTLQKGVAEYVGPFQGQNVLILSLGLNGLNGKAAWEEANIDDFVRELALTKYFEIDDPVGTTFVQTELLTGNEGHMVRNFISFVHQVLVYADPNLYSLEHIVEGFCRHPELTVKLCKLFALKFDPKAYDRKKFETQEKEMVDLIEKLDTGQAINDLRRKNILRQGLAFITHTVKTNFYRTNKTSFSFRINPHYLEDVPYNVEEKFPEIPFGIFFIRGMNFIGFNIRFKDLARGGVRTIIPEKREQFHLDRNNLFFEAYQLAYTQQKKNKDIPEGGAKTAILLKPTDVFQVEEEIFAKELQEEGLDPISLKERLRIYKEEQRQAYINASQRCFIDSLLTLINCDADGKLKSASIIDYLQNPEYIYLGPDENISNEMIVWITEYAVQRGYAPGRAFMSSSPKGGINHKQYGVTSYGLNVYMEEVLNYLKIDPKKDVFTIKISGGPDGDVAGNELLNLYKYYPKTAKVIALTDVSGTIFDPNGLDLKILAEMFKKSQSICNYPVENLNEGGFLLDLKSKKEESAYATTTKLSRKIDGKIKEEWLSGNEMNLMYRNNLHKTVTDIFITGGGRPRTLNEANIHTFLDPNGKPTSRAIIEGANLYLTPAARKNLEKQGVLIIKDSSCNKGGVITSSLEVLASLCMSEEDFLKLKEEYVKEVLDTIKMLASREGRLLLETHRKTGAFLTDSSEKTSEKINLFKYQIINYLKDVDLPNDPSNFLIKCLIQYAPPLLQKNYLDALLNLPPVHKKAIIACFIASRLVYHKGLDWNPDIVDILPTLALDSHIFDN